MKPIPSFAAFFGSAFTTTLSWLYSHNLHTVAATAVVSTLCAFLTSKTLQAVWSRIFPPHEKESK